MARVGAVSSAVAGSGVGAVGFPAAVGGVVEAAALEAFGKVALVDPARWVVVGIAIGTVFFGTGPMTVAQMVGDGTHRAVADFGKRRIDARFHRVAFRREGNIGGRMREVDPVFRI